MDTTLATEMIALIREERTRRLNAFRSEDPAYAYDRWLFTDEPFINELCLMLLVSIRHQLERELVRLAARASGNAAEIDGDEYRHRVEQEGDRLHSKDGWKRLIAKLNLASFSEWHTSLKTLQLLANNHKHDTSSSVGADLLEHLKLDPIVSHSPTVRYAPLPESHHFREALALSLSLQADADYCAIAEEFLSQANRFLTKVEGQPGLDTVKWGPVSLTDFVG